MYRPIERFTLNPLHGRTGVFDMSRYGEWVRYSDHAAIVAAHRARIAVFEEVQRKWFDYVDAACDPQPSGVLSKQQIMARQRARDKFFEAVDSIRTKKEKLNDEQN